MALCGGMGGSMHLTDRGVGALGSFAIVGAHLPFACGTALAAVYRGTDDVSVAFFGDGTTNIGAFHEAMNLAAVWHLPVIFVCENNLYGEYSPLDATTPVDRLADRAGSYAMPATTIDGNDVLAVRAATEEAVARARAGEGPTFLEMLTYRQRGTPDRIQVPTDPTESSSAGSSAIRSCCSNRSSRRSASPTSGARRRANRGRSGDRRHVAHGS